MFAFEFFGINAVADRPPFTVPVTAYTLEVDRNGVIELQFALTVVVDCIAVVSVRDGDAESVIVKSEDL